MLFNQLLNGLRSDRSQRKPEVNAACKIYRKQNKSKQSCWFSFWLFFLLVTGLSISSSHPQVFPQSDDRLMEAGLSPSPTLGTCRRAGPEQHLSKHHFRV